MDKVSDLMPWINGGGFATIALLFVWLLRSEIPRKETQAALERKEQRESTIAAMERLTTTFEKTMAAQRSDCKEEMLMISSSFDKAVQRLEARIVVSEIKREQG